MVLPYEIYEALRRRVIRKRTFASLRARRTAVEAARQIDPSTLRDLVDRYRLAIVPPTNIGKGMPDMAGIRGHLATALLDHLDGMPSGNVSATALSLGWHLAALDPADTGAFDIYLGAYALRHAEPLLALRDYLTRKVVLHVSCAPRVDRARESWASFSKMTDADVSHVIVIGGGAACTPAFDRSTGILIVPEGDEYEQLPAKVIGALSILAMTGKADCVLKVDDDHRLHDIPALRGFLERLSRDDGLALSGTIYRMGQFGMHSRAWHFGKSKDSNINETPYTGLSPLSWVTGEDGYGVTCAGLTMALGSRVHQKAYIDSAVYEDLALSNLVLSHGGTLRSHPMGTYLVKTAAY